MSVKPLFIDNNDLIIAVNGKKISDFRTDSEIVAQLNCQAILNVCNQLPTALTYSPHAYQICRANK